jgi:hypothetical protein
MFGITDVTSRHCIAQGCKKSATHVIGNTKYKYNLKNLFVCDEHLEELYNQLINQFGGDSKPVEQRNNEDNIKGQELLKGYVKLIYEANGMLSKAKLAEFCKENGLEVEEDLGMKKYMEILFPELTED